MQLLQNECQESTGQQQQQQEQEQQQKQASMTQEKPQQPSPQHKMDKFHPPKPKINAFNDLLTCFLCHGYIVNPTTIDACMHTYCRSCVVRHIRVDCCCPQCGKPATTANLVADEILRSIIFKLVPGLYQKERERVEQFLNKIKGDEDSGESSVQGLSDSLEINDHLFSPTDPISLSLEFHPALAEQCSKGSVPPVRYLQCPASVKVQHLKRFICSKFEIDPSNRKVGIEIIYEDEILPSDFTLMDIAYCYNWQRHAPLELAYRILLYNEDLSLKSDCGYVSDDKVSESSYKPDAGEPVPAALFNKMLLSEAERSPGCVNNGKVDAQTISSAAISSSKSKAAKSSSSKHTSFHAAPSTPEVPVKVTISRKPSESKKSVSKKSSATDEFVIPTTTNDFKSLRSNDIRYSNYAVTSSTTSAIDASAHTSVAKNLVQLARKEKPPVIKEEKSAKCDIVVSIPHNQMHEEWDSKPLSHLKTASKKSPNSTAMEAAVAPAPAKKVRNVPKLKIELNSLKTKLIEKPKSADIRLDTLMIKQHRPRKLSLDEPQPVVGKVDLETYVRNIGLKPIEVQTTSKVEAADKYTPNASPMSSCSSTTSSSASNFNFNCSADITSSSSSSHKKRKKKHSKESRESKDSKRKKMHAEISSHSAEESLKMKVKLTPSINLKSLKLDSKKPSSFGFSKTTDPLDFEKSKLLNSKIERNQYETPKSFEDKLYERSQEKLKSRSSETKKSKPAESKLYIPDVKRQKDLEKPKPLEIKTALSDSLNKSSTKEFDDDEDLVIPDSTSLGISKPLSAVRETKLPHSPPLPPSLFKTTPLTFSTFSPNAATVATVAKPQHIAPPKDKPKTPHMKPIAPKPSVPKPGQLSSPSPISSLKTPKFVVPNPPRFMPLNSTKFLTTPTSIASAANKHMGNLLKRSISLDETKNAGPSNKQQKLEKPNQITVSAYGSNLHMTKVEIPATPTSSTAKATYEIPLYSPLSAAYNPKCSFSVNSTTLPAKSTKSLLQNPTTSSATRLKHTFAANALATIKTDVDTKKTTTANDIKPSAATTSPASPKSVTILSSKTLTAPTTSITTLMGPPLPIQKINSSLAVIPAAVVPPPPSSVQPFSTPSTSTGLPTPVLNTAYLSSPLSIVNYRQSKVLLAHAKPTNLTEMKIEKETPTVAATPPSATTTATPPTTTAIKSSASTTNGLATEKPKCSLRQFRLPSRELGQDILDLSAPTKAPVNGVPEKHSAKPSAPSTPTPHGSSLEMALNKIKQNMCTTTTSATNAANSNTSNTLDHATKKQELLSPIADDLQNLHLLSESATAREKIAISTATTLSSTSTSLYEKAKLTQNSLVRQQNASVRNIPNPSALAFRNLQPVTSIPPMVTIAAGLATTLTSLDKSLLLKTPSPPKSPHSPNCSTSSTSPSRTASKKHPSIDQVAASLNQRASAAAEASAKANSKLADETLLVSSTSASLADNMDNKAIKQESAELQGDTAAAQPSCPLVSELDIKQEPEEKPEVTASGIKTPPAFNNVAAKTTTMTENLVTSVISVTSPTSTLLTATSAAAF